MESDTMRQYNGCWVPKTPEITLLSSVTGINEGGMTTRNESGHNLPFDSSCIDFLGSSSNGATVIGANQFGHKRDASAANIDQEPLRGTKKKNKKRKVALDLNKKPGEKRQFKYYWPKLDLQKGQTPKVKTPKSTPKPKTPNPKTPKLKKGVKIDVDVQGHKQEVLSCKRVLDFKDTIVDFENGGVKVVENQSFEALKQVPNTNGKDHTCVCLIECRELEYNFLDGCKRKRVGRKKKVIESFKDIEDNAKNLLPTKVKIVRDAFECILSLLYSSIKFKKGKRSTKRLARKYALNVSKQMFIQNNANSCNSILITSLEKQSSTPEMTCCSSSTELDKNGMHLALDQSNIENEQIHERSLQYVSTSLEIVPKNGSETNVAKVKAMKGSKTKVTNAKAAKRSYTRKGKRKDCFTKLKGWDQESVEQIIDPLVEYFEHMTLYEDPKLIEMKVLDMWSLILWEEGNEGGGSQKPYEKSSEFLEEVRILEAKMDRFYKEMTKLQGPKDYVKWNGSVVDSVVGVFLTQNVSDVLSSNAFMELASRYPIKSQSNEDGECGGGLDILSNSQESTGSNVCSNVKGPIIEYPDEIETTPTEDDEEDSNKAYDNALKEMLASLPNFLGKEKKGEVADNFDWESIRVQFVGKRTQRSPDARDSVDWEAVRKAPVKDISNAIEQRGQHRIIAQKIQRTLNRIVDKHGVLDLEWLREAPYEVAKAYLLSFYGLGLKSVECLRLLTLGHDGFPVDVNIGRIAVRLGWVPLQPLPDEIPFHLLEKYPLESDIQQYIWPRLRNLEKEKLYKIHYQMITFGKVFCRKQNPNCRGCPFKNECKYYQSRLESLTSKHPLLMWKKGKMMALKSKKCSKKNKNVPNPFDIKNSSYPRLLGASISYTSLDMIPKLDCNLNAHRWRTSFFKKCDRHNPIIEFPASPKRVDEQELLPDIEDLFKDSEVEVNDEITSIDISTQKYREKLVNQFEKSTVSLQSDEPSRALISLSHRRASIPLRKQIRLRTEHQVYELPYNHPLLKDLERQCGEIPYLLAIWTQGENKKSDALEGCIDLNKVPDESLTVLGTLLIPARTAMRESFPLNGTYFQRNEVFADDESSQCPIKVPRSSIWMLKKRTLYCGYGTPAIFTDLPTEDIRHCFWEGYICVRGFNRRTRAPKPLSIKFHKGVQVKSKLQDEQEAD